jgi:hypothetical protein
MKIGSDPPPKGSIRRAAVRLSPDVVWAKVIQVINENEVLATIPDRLGEELLIIHVKGVNGKVLTEGAKLGCLIFRYLGQYTYDDTKGAKRTVQSYVRCREVSKEEFALALSKGLILHDYKLVPSKEDTDNPDWELQTVHGKKGDRWYKVVETNVP